MNSHLAQDYVDAALAQRRRLDRMAWPADVPERMRDPGAAEAGPWVRWKPIASTVTDAELDALEREIGLTFPPLYRAFLEYLHFVALTETGLRFEPHLCDGWLQTLRRAYFKSWPRERILDLGLLPFGEESLMDAGPVCFDTRSRLADGDCPVVFWDHAWQHTDKEVRLMFSSCAHMFGCLTLVAQTDIDFVYHEFDEDAQLLRQKQQLLRCFLAFDPQGAGGPARAYWSCWGVTPAE